MYIVDGIAYAGEMPKPLRVKSVRPLPDYKLMALFTNGERRLFDFKPLLDLPCYQPLKDIDTFRGAYIELGAVAWSDDIDIAPETIFEKGIPVANGETA